MAYRKRLRSREDKLHSWGEEEECKVDRISLLPDELLVSVLCLLSLKEATATSIVSRRWRYLHTWTRKLDLDGTNSILKLMKIYKPHMDKERCNYIKWVDHIISKHKSSIIEEFRLFYDLDRSNSRTIKEWLRFALSRKVEKLELNLTDKGSTMSRLYSENYIFPYKHYVEEFKYLKKLSTNHVNVSGEFVKELLRNCPLLQHLSLTLSGALRCLEIIKPFPSFEILEISVCNNLKSLVICDSNIVNLKLNLGKRIRRVVLENVPLLTEFWHWPDITCVSMMAIRCAFSSVLPQIRLLKLNILLDGLEGEDTKKFCSGVELSNLRQLVVVDNGTNGKSLPHLIKLINVSPRLEELMVESPEDYCKPGEYHPKKMEMGGGIPKKYPCLKEIKIVGYHASRFEFEMVKHFVDNGVALEDIVVDSRSFTFELDSWWDYLPPQATASGKRLAMAHQLRKYVPSRINMTIL